jgi:hypothetical protein
MDLLIPIASPTSSMRWSREARQLEGIRNAPRRRLLAGVVVVLLMVTAACEPISASEYGVSTYRPGLMDLYAGMLPPPGHGIVKDLFLFQDASAKVVTADGRIEVDTHTITYTDAVLALYVTRLPVLGAYWAFGTIQMLRIASQSLNSGLHGGALHNQSTTIGGLGDGIFIPGLLNWDFGQLHVSAAFSFYAPTGQCDPTRIITLGLNRWAFEPDVGLTWMDQGREASLFFGYTVNTENTADHYQSGQEFHADFALAQHFHNGFLFGTAGYAFEQTTADSGSGAILGPFKGSVIGLGPMVGQTVTIREIPISFTFKYDVEFAEQNRSSGNELWFTTCVHF